MPSYATSHASAARSSRVETALRPLGALVRVADLPGRDARFVLVSPLNVRVGVDLGETCAIYATNGALASQGEKFVFDSLTMLDSAFLVGAYEKGWTGGDGHWLASTAMTEGGKLWALRDGGDVVTSVVQAPKSRFNGELPRLVLQASHQDLPPREGRELLWIARIDGMGCGAIAPDGRVALAMDDGRFRVFDALGDPDTQKPVVGVDVALRFAAYDIAAVGGGYVLLHAVAAEAGPDAEVPEDERWRRLLAPWTSRTQWFTRVVSLDAAGTIEWEVTVPFEVLQPPVDGGGGRVYVAGRGLAALEGGEVAWGSGAPERTYATAFGDGHVALVSGDALRVVARDGAIRRAWRSPRGDAFTTPPAIASDGAIWVATAEGLYVAQ